MFGDIEKMFGNISEISKMVSNGYNIDIKTDKEEIQKWIDFMFLNDNIAACIRSYCGKYKLSELEMYKMICVALIRKEYENGSMLKNEK